MATWKNIPNMPIELNCTSDPIQVCHKRTSIIIDCDYKNVILTTGLFIAPQFIRNVKGQFWFESPEIKTAIYKTSLGDGVFLVTGDAYLFKRLSAIADGSFSFESSAHVYEYLKATGLQNETFYIADEKPSAKQSHVLRTDNAFVISGFEPVGYVCKIGSSDEAIKVTGIALADRITYTNTDETFSLSGVASAIVFGYESFIPAGSDSGLLDAAGEEFVVVRSDDDGV